MFAHTSVVIVRIGQNAPAGFLLQGASWRFHAFCHWKVCWATIHNLQFISFMLCWFLLGSVSPSWAAWFLRCTVIFDLFVELRGCDILPACFDLPQKESSRSYFELSWLVAAARGFWPPASFHYERLAQNWTTHLALMSKQYCDFATIDICFDNCLASSSFEFHPRTAAILLENSWVYFEWDSIHFYSQLQRWPELYSMNQSHQVFEDYNLVVIYCCLSWRANCGASALYLMQMIDSMTNSFIHPMSCLLLSSDLFCLYAPRGFLVWALSSSSLQTLNLNYLTSRPIVESSCKYAATSFSLLVQWFLAFSIIEEQ